MTRWLTTATSHNDMINLTNIFLDYARGSEVFPVLRNITMDIPDGCRLAVIGPSGCGKTTLLKLLSGTLSPTSGQISYNGEPLMRPRPDVSVIQQDYGLFPWKTVLQNVGLPLLIRGISKQEISGRTDDVLSRLGLSEHCARYPGELSGGQRQRAAIARALISHPKFLLMDEPFSALDELTRETLQDTIVSLCQTDGLTLITVTHDIEEAAFLGEKVLVFGPGTGNIRGIADSPDAADRSSPAFFAQCTQLRAMLGEART